MERIVAGADGSEFSMRAVEWAAAEAVRRHAALHVVNVAPRWLFGAGASDQDWWRGITRVLEAATARARSVAPDLACTTDVVPGQPAGGLLEAAENAALLVVGARGSGEFGGLVMGSTALQVVTHSTRPVVVVRQESLAAHRQVLVGVDGSPTSRQAIAFAFGEAALRKATLHVVHAWIDPVSTAPGDMLPLVYDLDDLAADERRLLAENLAGFAEDHPDVQVIEDSVHARAVRALTAASARADLLVVGSRGMGGFAGLLLGSVSHSMLFHAHCPVAVIPPMPS